MHIVYCCTHRIVLHAGLFSQTQEADGLIRPNCGVTLSRKPLAIAMLDLELPCGILTKFKLASLWYISDSTGTYVVLDRYSCDKVKLL